MSTAHGELRVRIASVGLNVTFAIKYMHVDLGSFSFSFEIAVAVFHLITRHFEVCGCVHGIGSLFSCFIRYIRCSAIRLSNACFMRKKLCFLFKVKSMVVSCRD